MRIVIKKDEPIVDLDDMLYLIFGVNQRYKSMARRIIEHIVKHGYLEAEKWIELVIAEIKEIIPSLGDDLEELYIKLKENNASNYIIQNALRERAKEFAKEHNIPNPFNIMANAYVRTIKRLRDLGLVYRKHKKYYLSEQFIRRLQEVINLWSGYCKKAEKNLYSEIS